MRRSRHRCAALGLALAAVPIATAADPHPEWTLWAPLGGMTDTFLIDLGGNLVHTWSSVFGPGASVYMTDAGALIRTAHDPSVQPFGGPGVGGRIERIAWDGTIEWSYVAAGTDYVQHHDIEILPNGNVLAIVWERYTAAEAIAMGRDPANVGAELWSEGVLEIQPTGPTSGTIVWEWHLWDHLVQDSDGGLPNFGDPADNPGRVDINYDASNAADWLHFNGIDYNATLDQILLSANRFDEIWIISHDPADSGDLLYRWGNPEAYGRGTGADRKLFGQHDPEWIAPGLPGAGNVTVFNNGVDRGFSSADEFDTGVNPDGTYDLLPGQPYGPTSLTSTCATIDGAPFLANIQSSVQRLPNGNQLVCLGPGGAFIEMDRTCATVWSHAAGGFIFRALRLDAHDARIEDLLWAVGDTNDDLIVNVLDILTVLAQWGTAGPEGDVAPPPDGDGVVDVLDLLLVLAEWD